MLPFGVATLTAQTIISQGLAYLLLEPPRTLIHKITLAQVLSTTLSKLSV